MDTTEAKVRCLELAVALNRPTGEHSADAVVKIANTLYAFIEPSPPAETPEVSVDKPKRGRAPRATDPFS